MLSTSNKNYNAAEMSHNKSSKYIILFKTNYCQWLPATKSLQCTQAHLIKRQGGKRMEEVKGTEKGDKWKAQFFLQTAHHFSDSFFIYQIFPGIPWFLAMQSTLSVLTTEYLYRIHG